MKKITQLLVVLALTPAVVTAQTSSSTSSTRSSAHAANVTYGYAQVLRVEPIYETVTSHQADPQCAYENSASTSGTTSALIGALVGGALGSTVGKGDGKTAATVAGAVAGAAIGNQVGKSNNVRQYCSDGQSYREEQRISGYDVEYQYKGAKYMSRLPYDPGNQLRVKVSVTPDVQTNYNY